MTGVLTTRGILDTEADTHKRKMARRHREKPQEGGRLEGALQGEEARDCP